MFFYLFFYSINNFSFNLIPFSVGEKNEKSGLTSQRQQPQPQSQSQPQMAIDITAKPKTSTSTSASSSSSLQSKTPKEELLGTSKKSENNSTEEGGGIEKVKNARKTTEEIKQRLQQAREGLDKRGETLSNMVDKASEMEANSRNFLEKARELRKKQEGSWFNF